MKKITIVFTMILIAAGSFSQMPEKFVMAMEQKVPSVDTALDVNSLMEMANAFERIADAEKTQWLAYYYAALCNANAGLMMGGGNIMAGNAEKTDPIADKAEKLLDKAEALMKDNSEIFVVKKMIATLRMMGDPMNRYMTYGPLAEQALQTARKLDPENPRTYLLEGQDKFFTPEQFGGSKSAAKVLFETAMKKFESAKPETSIHPSWGLPATKYFHSQIQ
ncbi:MAG TPA: hypothetical protein VI548_13445 [Chitinophagaceae bacterium]|nr:hypothetical protein [Chitinophagaceae bacterium]